MDDKRTYDEQTMIEFEAAMAQRVAAQPQNEQTLQESMNKLKSFFENLANALRDVIEKAWSFFKDIAWNFEQVEQLEKQKNNNYFVPVQHTKGRMYKSQVQNNKPRIAKARSNL